MLVAYELKKTLSELYATMDHDELGWWLAFIKRKQQVEDEQHRKNVAKRNKGRQ